MMFFSSLFQELVKLVITLLAEVHPEEGFLHHIFLHMRGWEESIANIKKVHATAF